MSSFGQNIANAASIKLLSWSSNEESHHSTSSEIYYDIMGVSKKSQRCVVFFDLLLLTHDSRCADEYFYCEENINVVHLMVKCVHLAKFTWFIVTWCSFYLLQSVCVFYSWPSLVTLNVWYLSCQFSFSSVLSCRGLSLSWTVINTVLVSHTRICTYTKTHTHRVLVCQIVLLHLSHSPFKHNYSHTLPHTHAWLTVLRYLLKWNLLHLITSLRNIILINLI